MIKLGTPCFDIATDLPGMATHISFELDGSSVVAFQPKGSNPENGKPIKSMWVAPSRVRGDEIELDKAALPFHVLGTMVEDKASGFKGTAISMVLHINGCVHFMVQPHGKHEKTGAPIEPCDFDLRRLSGPTIKELTPMELETSHREKPSPMEIEPRH